MLTPWPMPVIDYDALRSAPDAEVIAILTAVTGIGVWTAEIYAMFSLAEPMFLRQAICVAGGGAGDLRSARAPDRAGLARDVAGVVTLARSLRHASSLPTTGTLNRGDGIT